MAAGGGGSSHTRGKRGFLWYRIEYTLVQTLRLVAAVDPRRGRSTRRVGLASPAAGARVAAPPRPDDGAARASRGWCERESDASVTATAAGMGPCCCSSVCAPHVAASARAAGRVPAAAPDRARQVGALVAALDSDSVRHADSDSLPLPARHLGTVD